MGKIKYGDLDGMVFVTDAEFSTIQREESVRVVREKLKMVQGIKEEIALETDQDLIDDLKEDVICYDLIANRLAISVGKADYEKFGLDKDFGLSYDELKVKNGYDVEPTITPEPDADATPYNEDDDFDDEDDFIDI